MGDDLNLVKKKNSMIRPYKILIATAITFLVGACARADDSSAEVDRIKAEALAAYPTDPVAASKAANAALERRALQAHSTNPKEVAALVFLGYYTKNVYEIPKVCVEQDIDLKDFVNAFLETNRAPFEAAAKLVDSKAFIERAKPSANTNARAELTRFAAVQRTNLKGACSFIQENAVGMASGAKFANILPKIYEQLVGQ